MIFIKAAGIANGKDISGKAEIEVHTSSHMKDDRHGQGSEYLATLSVFGLRSGN